MRSWATALKRSESPLQRWPGLWSGQSSASPSGLLSGARAGSPSEADSRRCLAGLERAPVHWVKEVGPIQRGSRQHQALTPKACKEEMKHNPSLKTRSAHPKPAGEAEGAGDQPTGVPDPSASEHLLQTGDVLASRPPGRARGALTLLSARGTNSGISSYLSKAS